MIITLIIWVYISFACYGWGVMILNALKTKKEEIKENDIHPVLIFLIGLSGIGAFIWAISLFFPLSRWSLQLAVITPSLAILLKRGAASFKPTVVQRSILAIYPALIILGCIMTLVILIMSSWTINHPDTVGYHIQIIKWMEEFKAVPGIANINHRLGLQSIWFSICATFNFSFIKNGHFTYINSCTTVWICYFFIYQINKSIRDKKIPDAFFLTFLLALIFGSYTQIRLTATSNSPDFISAIYTALAIYLLYSRKEVSPGIVFFLSFFSCCIKFSALPILIISLYLLIQVFLKQKKLNLYTVLFTLTLLISTFARNAITSGYIFFPSIWPDIIEADWKLNKEQAANILSYVEAYAKTESDFSPAAVLNTREMKPAKWLPIWWKHRSVADRIIIVLLCISIVLALSNLRKLFKLSAEKQICILTSFLGIMFWFVKAPDPRFGFGFIIPFITMISDQTRSKFLISFFCKKNYLIKTIYCISFLLGWYFIHRAANFFSIQQLIYPIGVVQQPSHRVDCNGTMFNIVSYPALCGETSLPCIEDTCGNFVNRGAKISDGFSPGD